MGFLLDSSGSISGNYDNEKSFLKSIAGIFDISTQISRVGVITYSGVAEHTIKLKDHPNIVSFYDAVDAIPLMNSVTRIDLALRLAQNEMFTTANGGRSSVPDILILMTDGTQTQTANSEDPATIADELRKTGVTIIVLGMGSGINLAELTKIARGPEMVFTAATFTELNSATFKTSVKDLTCLGTYSFSFCLFIFL